MEDNIGLLSKQFNINNNDDNYNEHHSTISYIDSNNSNNSINNNIDGVIISEDKEINNENHNNHNNNNNNNNNNKDFKSKIKNYLLDIKPFLLYCSFSFLFSFDPSEPFLVDYLTNVLNINQNIVYQEIFPYWTYSYFVFLLVFGFLGEIIGYKVIIIIGMIAKVLTLGVLLTTNNIVWMILEQITEGLAYAAYIVFLAYIYFSLDTSDYQKMASRVNAGYLVGIVSSGLLGQFLVQQKTSLVLLLVIACVTNILALILALGFTNYKVEQKFSFKEVFYDLINTYKNTDILRWYVWSGIAISIHQIVLTYWQILFLQINNEQSWNGYISASAYFFASFFAIIPSKLGNAINNIQNLILVLFGFLGGGLLVIMGVGSNTVVSALSFIIYNCCFEFMSPIVNVQIAKKLSSRIGILFSFNILMALSIQVLVQFAVGKQFLNLDIKTQFYYYGACLFILSIGFAVLFLFLYLKSRYYNFKNNNHNNHKNHNNHNINFNERHSLLNNNHNNNLNNNNIDNNNDDDNDNINKIDNNNDDNDNNIEFYQSFNNFNLNNGNNINSNNKSYSNIV